MAKSNENGDRRSGKDRRSGLERRDPERGHLRVPGSTDRRHPGDRRRTIRREEDRAKAAPQRHRGH